MDSILISVPKFEEWQERKDEKVAKLSLNAKLIYIYVLCERNSAGKDPFLLSIYMLQRVIGIRTQTITNALNEIIDIGLIWREMAVNGGEIPPRKKEREERKKEREKEEKIRVNAVHEYGESCEGACADSESVARLQEIRKSMAAATKKVPI
jgi:hypothetical protein